MKLYAQHGHGEGQKLLEGIKRGLIDGVIFSPKDTTQDRLAASIAALRTENRSTDIFFDPQFYACFAAQDGASNIGNLADEFTAYFTPRRRSQLLSEKQVLEDLKKTIEFQASLPLSAIIAPNILIPRSFDSTESAIAMEFIRNAARVARDLPISLPLYATLAVSSNALIDKEELQRFLNDLTVLDERPAGFYLLVAVNSVDARAEIYHADVIAGWMFLNHVLRLNGYQTINGYSDILSPFLGAAGASAGATGWWSNLRTFSLDRFGPPMGGGRLPLERYLSCNLLNRLTFSELEAIRGVYPRVLNGLTTDVLYPAGSSQPQRAQEVLQTWDAVRKLQNTLVRNDIAKSLALCLTATKSAQALYDNISARLPMQLDPKSNDQHIEPLQEGLSLFGRLAELEMT